MLKKKKETKGKCSKIQFVVGHSFSLPPDASD